jgi:hypothetical protein
MVIRVVSVGLNSALFWKANEYVMERIAIRKKNETAVEWIGLFVKKYSKARYSNYHEYALAGFYAMVLLLIVYRQKWGKKVIKSKVL